MNLLNSKKFIYCYNDYFVNNIAYKNFSIKSLRVLENFIF